MGIAKLLIAFSLLGIGMFYFNQSNFFENSNYPSNYFSLEKFFQKNPELQKSILRGSDVYSDFCIKCHLVNGKGDAVNPPLDASDWLLRKRKESIYAVKFGLSGEIVVNGKKYNSSMSPMGLTDREIADVMNYIMSSWNNELTLMVTEAEVEAIKK